MNAIEFVKKFGLDKARNIVNDLTKFKDYRKPTHWDSDLNILHDFKVLDESDVSVADIEQIVDAFELVESFGGLFQAKVTFYKEGFTGGIECGDRLIEDDVLKQAIELVEECNES